MKAIHASRFLLAVALCGVFAQAQEPDMVLRILGGQTPVIAIPDLRGAGDAQPLMGAFNDTLFAAVKEAGILTMAPKSMFPLRVPQQPADWSPGGTPWLTEWSGPPVNSTYLAIGYTAVRSGSMVLFGWLYNVQQRDVANAQIFGKIYTASLGAAGARDLARQFADDILKTLGGVPLTDTKIYFRSTRSGHPEIWSMNYDGSEQHQITKFGSISMDPAVSPDGRLLALMTFEKARGGVEHAIKVMSIESNRFLPFVNPRASMLGAPSFTADGKRLLFSARTGAARSPNIFSSELNGSDLRPISFGDSIEMEPRANPRTGDILFTSGRTGKSQVFRMNGNGANIQMLSSGDGEAVNAVWNPAGNIVAFATTAGYAPGHYNIVIIDPVSREMTQLTRNQGSNEHPWFAPDGRHIVFASNRSGARQIWSMLADAHRCAS